MATGTAIGSVQGHGIPVTISVGDMARELSGTTTDSSPITQTPTTGPGTTGHTVTDRILTALGFGAATSTVGATLLRRRRAAISSES